jgi:acyl-CoA thioesterase FadM
MGRLREQACAPVFARMAELFASGRWGMATNLSRVDVHADVGREDAVEGRIWLAGLTGPYRSTMDLRFSWHRVPWAGEDVDGAPEEAVASGRMLVTWVAVRDGGAAEVQPFPPFLQAYAEGLLGLPGDGEPRATAPTEARVIAPGVALREETFATSQEDANLVGNLYFSLYPAWQGRVVERWVHAAGWAAGRAGGAGRGELRCRSCELDYLREAVPYDTIRVRITAASADERSVTMAFEHERDARDGSQKLAVGRMTLDWWERSESGVWRPAPLPMSLQPAEPSSALKSNWRNSDALAA